MSSEIKLTFRERKKKLESEINKLDNELKEMYEKRKSYENNIDKLKCSVKDNKKLVKNLESENGFNDFLWEEKNRSFINKIKSFFFPKYFKNTVINKINSKILNEKQNIKNEKIEIKKLIHDRRELDNSNKILKTRKELFNKQDEYAGYKDKKPNEYQEKKDQKILEERKFNQISQLARYFRLPNEVTVEIAKHTVKAEEENRNKNTKR